MGSSVSIRDSLVKEIVTRGRQLTKVVSWASSWGTVDLLSHSRPWDESTDSRPPFPDSGDGDVEFQGLPFFLANIVFL